MSLRALGLQLRAAGLTARALDAWATARLAALPLWLAQRPSPWSPPVGAPLREDGSQLRALLRDDDSQLRAPHHATLRPPPDGDPRPMQQPRAASAPQTPAAALLALLVAGDTVPRARLRAPLDAMHATGLVGLDGDAVRASVAILPLGDAFLVCDRLDAPVTRERVSWPDDSSYHLAGAIPAGRRARWLDLACGSAFAPLARPGLAASIHCVDLNPRAVAHAALGAALSGTSHITCAVADIGARQPPADLVTCNAPIPARDPVSPELWRRAEPGFFDRLWPALAHAVAPGGLIVIHAAHDALIAGLSTAPGARTLLRYTPDDARAFGVAWWRPDAPSRLTLRQRRLTADRPHIDAHDDDA